MKLSLAFVALAALASAVAAVDPSTPTTGQAVRYRALPRDSNLALVPVDGAEFLAGQRFDIGIELHSLDPTVTPDLSTLSFTINGKAPSDILGALVDPKPFIVSYNSTFNPDLQSRDAGVTTQFSVTKATWRNVYLPASGSYDIKISAGKESVSAKWVAKGSKNRKAKNVLLFIGDGMAPSMIAAARYISKNTKFGKFENGDGFLNMESMGTIGKIATNGIDSFITDSANSAGAYLSGHKSWVNGLNVYSDTSSDTLDDPKVETLAEVIRRTRPGMCIGVVTTANVADATPAAVYSHTRRRNDEPAIIDQMINGFNHYLYNSTTSKFVNASASPEKITWGPAVKADVFLGGGAQYFNKSASALFGQDYFGAFSSLGYTVAFDKASLDAAPKNAPLLGIFHTGHMDTWYDREVSTSVLSLAKNPTSPKYDGTWATSQPGLEQMTLKAIDVMEARCTDGWFLMSEAASVDKAMHPMDYDRGLADLLELDRTLKKVLERDTKKETAIFLTADHSQAFDVYGSVDIKYFRSANNNDTIQADGKPSTPSDPSLHIAQRQSIGVYADAGWPDNVLDANGLPSLLGDARFRLAAGKVDSPNAFENYEHKTPAKGSTANPLTRNPSVKTSRPDYAQNTIITSQGIYVYDPLDTNAVGLPRGGNLPTGQSTSVHSLQTVDLYCAGPVAASCARVMDNTELFFLMADALGLGDSAEYTPPSPTCDADNTSSTTVTVTVTYTATPTSGSYGGDDSGKGATSGSGSYGGNASPSTSTTTPAANYGGGAPGSSTGSVKAASTPAGKDMLYSSARANAAGVIGLAIAAVGAFALIL
ncbi:alkaline-phosphatase-like protein [Zopfochytrium polystomum]|nr:alkaline-phosphatase-like protein [Zopfochytrium polystomum]